jgi:hypothetical protein
VGHPPAFGPVQAVAKDLQRKVAKRNSREMVLPVERFINTRWGDHFTGLGTGKPADAVTRTAAPQAIACFNRCRLGNSLWST